jgi:membrane associated rhomboid family serine protease
MSLLKRIVESIKPDKKDHNILGDIVNPIIYVVAVLLFGLNGFIYGFIACLVFHFGIELLQYIFKTGKCEFWDAVSGSYSAILIFITYLYIQLTLGI